MKRVLLMSLLVVAFALAAAVPAQAAPAPNFGTHIRHHLEMHGHFTGDMNPGMHQGFSNWPGEM